MKLRAQIESEIVGSVQEEARSGLPASAAVGIVMKADVHRRDFNLPTQFPVDFVDHLFALQTPGDIRLIRHDNQDESCGRQSTNG